MTTNITSALRKLYTAVVAVKPLDKNTSAGRLSALKECYKLTGLIFDHIASVHDVSSVVYDSGDDDLWVMASFPQLNLLEDESRFPRSCWTVTRGELQCALKGFCLARNKTPQERYCLLNDKPVVSPEELAQHLLHPHRFAKKKEEQAAFSRLIRSYSEAPDLTEWASLFFATGLQLDSPFSRRKAQKTRKSTRKINSQSEHTEPMSEDHTPNHRVSLEHF